MAEQTTPEIPGYPELKMLPGAPLSRYTTWRIGGPADFVVRVANPAQLAAAVEWGWNEGLPVYVIGGGSNILASDDGLAGLVIISKTAGEKSIGLLDHEDLGDRIRARVGAQAPLSWFGRYCSEQGWAGMDWGVGLPGTIGGATVNNAGAHGTELKDHLHRVRVLGQDHGDQWFPATWLDASYRHTIIKDQLQPRKSVVLESEFLLPRGDAAALERLADEHAAYRKATQPTGRCAGSTFTNPEGDFAGRLLEVAGLKEFAVGGARFSAIHSNFIVNDGSATAVDVLELIHYAQERVADQFAIALKPEIEILGTVPGMNTGKGK